VPPAEQCSVAVLLPQEARAKRQDGRWKRRPEINDTMMSIWVDVDAVPPLGTAASAGCHSAARKKVSTVPQIVSD